MALWGLLRQKQTNWHITPKASTKRAQEHKIYKIRPTKITYKREKVHKLLGNSVTNIDVIKLIAKPGQRDNKRDKTLQLCNWKPKLIQGKEK